VVAASRAVSAAVGEAGALASGGVELARSCDAPSLQGFGVIRDLSISELPSVGGVAAVSVIIS